MSHLSPSQMSRFKKPNGASFERGAGAGRGQGLRHRALRGQRQAAVRGTGGAIDPNLRAALAVHKAAILDMLEAERLAARRIVRCFDCLYHIASTPIQRASGITWDMPGGCEKGLTSAASAPAIYPCTGWYCDCWASRTLQ